MNTISCISCDGTEFETLFYSQDRLLKVDKTCFRVARCSKCGLVCLNPQPSMEELSKYYPSTYAPYSSTETFSQGPIWSALKKIFGRSHQQVGPRPITSDTSSSTYLDFGCGGGINLDRVHAEHPNWELHGFDNSPTACARTREKGFSVYEGELTEGLLPNAYFDRIHLGHVIEHLPNPAQALTILAAAMKPGGEITLSTPNFDSYAAKIFRTYWRALETPRHLFLFTPETLGKILNDAGFDVEDIDFDRGPKVAIRSLYHLVGRVDMRINPFLWRLLFPLSYLAARHRKSSIMTVRARKR